MAGESTGGFLACQDNQKSSAQDVIAVTAQSSNPDSQ
jgi:hypothetical protein